MSHPRRPRNALGRLLDAAKKRKGCEWPEIDLELGMSKSTRESWLNGNVRDPSLKAVMRLARLLEVTPAELEAAVLFDVLPYWYPLYANGDDGNHVIVARSPDEPGGGSHQGSAAGMSEKHSESPRARKPRRR